MYGPDYIMLARSDDGDESNIDAESGHLLSGATGRQPLGGHRATRPPRTSPPGSGLLYALWRRTRAAHFPLGLCGAIHRQHVSRRELSRTFAAQVQHHLRSGLLVPDPARDGGPLQRET